MVIAKMIKMVSNSGRLGQLVPVAGETDIRNIYHCCPPKSASQWLRAILSDDRVFRASGLRSYLHYEKLPDDFDPRDQLYERFHAPMPDRTIVTPLYIGYGSFKTLPKPSAYRAFFVLRDPRDLVVSWYFSVRYSHPEMGPIRAVRAQLDTMSEQDGLKYSIEALQRFGVFDALASWHQAASVDPHVRLVRFEHLVGPASPGVLSTLLNWCGINLPLHSLRLLLHDYSFERLSAGRKPGQEDQKSHYRMGVAGNWRNHFSEGTERVMQDITGNLATVLGYA